MQPRINDPASVREEDVQAVLDRGWQPTIQFSTRPSPAVLGEVNRLCQAFGERLEVRFYAHYDEVFDAAVVDLLPDVEWLSVDCLQHIRNEDRLGGLPRLRKFGFDVFEFDRPDFLASLPIGRLESLRVSANRKANLDLAPVAQGARIETLRVGGLTRNLDALGGLPRLARLMLGSIPKRQDLAFVNRLPALRDLTLILGGRSHIDDLTHPGLEALEVNRVRGVASLGALGRFFRLRRLQVEDQLQLREIDLAGAPLEELLLVNYKQLARLDGLETLIGLRHLRVVRTALDLDALADRPWPPSLEIVALYGGGVQRDAEIRGRLDLRGYREFNR